MKEDLIAFGTWVRLRRQALVLTREELASRVGCAEVTIRKIEADERKPSPQVAELLAQQLGLPRDQHELFVRVARGMLAVAQLPPAILGTPVAAVPVAVIPQPSVTPSLPTGTVTFLFTDIEGSTRRWEQHPDAMRVALARHDVLVRQAIEAHGGHVFKTVGDAFCAAFAAAPAALLAAVASQRALVREGWGVIGPIRVRMALHTGTAEPQNGDYLGQPLNRVARLLAAGHGGQILLSLATHELVRDHLPEGASVRDLGSHRLKDLVRPEPIYQLNAAGVPTDFPALTSLDARSTNLPVQVNALIGRTREVVEVRDLLGRARLVTLTGPGGTGKTRLALQIASELIDMYPDGVWFIDLSPISDGTQVAAAIAQALGIPESPERSIRDGVLGWARDHQALVVLDNCEQIIVGVADLVADMLRSAANLQVLATSRIPLRIAAEREYAVEPLALPDLAALPGLTQLSQYEAVALFITRAQAVRTDFTVTNSNAPAVAEICIRLDGLPLAIELAAARMRLFTPEHLLSRLIAAHIATLAGGARDLPTRQQTIRATIDWSYRLLVPEQQRLFARFGVFVGGWTLAAAEAVCADPGIDVVEGLAMLVEQSLVKLVGTGNEPRYVMLETIREYALERLAANGELHTIQHQHAEYYLALAEQTQPHLLGRERSTWLDRLELAHDNLRAALRWALAGGNVGIGAGIAIALAGHDWDGLWFRMLHWGEGWRWLNAVLAHRDALTPRLHAWVLLLTAVYRGILDGNPYLAQRAVLDEALTLFRTVGDQSGIAYVLRYQGGYDARDYGDIALVEESLALYKELGDHYHYTRVLHHLGCIARDYGDIGQAVALLEQCLVLSREHGYVRETCMILNNVGDAACIQGNLSQATAYYWEAFQLVQDEMNDFFRVQPLMNLGWLALVQGDDGRVLALMRQQVEWSQAQAVLSTLINLNQVLGALVNMHGDNVEATTILRAGLILQQQFAEYDVMSESLEAFADVAVGQSCAVRAARLLGAAAALRTTLGARRVPAARLAYERDVASARAQLDEATFDAAWAAGQELTLEQAIAEALNELA